MKGRIVMKITNCKTSHLIDPVGCSIGRQPVFSWTVEEAVGKNQKEARILVSKNSDMSHPVYDSGFDTSLDSLASPVSMDLSPRTRYYWTVTVRTDTDGEESTSDIHYFETAKMQEPWLGRWITCSWKDGRHPVFHRHFILDKRTESGRLYITGLGLYEAYLDGHKIGDEYLTPGCNDYDAWIEYQTYEIPALDAGKHELAVIMGNGWYKGRFGFVAKDHGYYGNSWNLIAELHLRTPGDDEEIVIPTNESWNVTRSAITFSTMYDGEHCDDTLEDTDPVPALLSGPSIYRNRDLIARISQPVTAHERIRPVSLLHTPAGETVLDLGQNFAGIFSLHVHEPAGTMIHLQFGELLQDGNFFNKNLRTAKQEFIYISDGNEKTVRPHFTSYGYRYVKIEGIPDLQKDDFTGIALYSDLLETGELKTGNNMVNQLISNTIWGMKSNFVGIPTDCPQRDERLGWTGDTQVFSGTASFFRDTWTFYHRYLTDMNYEQAGRDGLVPNVVPSFGEKDTACVWGDAACIIPWNLYAYYGDPSILSSHYDGMRAWVDYIRRFDGSDHAWERCFHWGDWLALDNPSEEEGQLFGGTDNAFIADVYYMHSADIVSQSAAILGKSGDARSYRELSDSIRAHIQHEYYAPGGRCCINTQTALLLTLQYHLSSNEDLIRKMLRKLFLYKKDTLQTGFVGTPILCNVLSDNGMTDLAWKLLLYEGYPGWLYSVKMGATTIWERWDAIDSDGHINASSMCSLNHYSYGAVTEWIWRHAAGINMDPSVPGFRKVIFDPSVNARAHSAEGIYHSAAGTWKSSWRIVDADHLEISLEVPFGCTAEIRLPHAPSELLENASASTNPIFNDMRDGVCHLVPGSYSITYNTDQPLFARFSADSKIGDLKNNPEAAKIVTGIMPAFNMLPETLNDSPFRPFALQYGAQVGLTTEKIDEIDAALKKLG
ncbi:MAG: family 78 glycoside hydrolase catalytic domain [Bilifractor sp.]|jgi:alpha-L-rhamnosidase